MCLICNTRWRQQAHVHTHIRRNHPGKDPKRFTRKDESHVEQILGKKAVALAKSLPRQHFVKMQARAQFAIQRKDVARVQAKQKKLKPVKKEVPDHQTGLLDIETPAELTQVVEKRDKSEIRKKETAEEKSLNEVKVEKDSVKRLIKEANLKQVSVKLTDVKDQPELMKCASIKSSIKSLNKSSDRKASTRLNRSPARKQEVEQSQARKQEKKTEVESTLTRRSARVRDTSPRVKPGTPSEEIVSESDQIRRSSRIRDVSPRVKPPSAKMSDNKDHKETSSNVEGMETESAVARRSSRIREVSQRVKPLASETSDNKDHEETSSDVESIDTESAMRRSSRIRDTLPRVKPLSVKPSDNKNRKETSPNLESLDIETARAMRLSTIRDTSHRVKPLSAKGLAGKDSGLKEMVTDIWHSTKLARSRDISPRVKPLLPRGTGPSDSEETKTLGKSTMVRDPSPKKPVKMAQMVIEPQDTVAEPMQPPEPIVIKPIGMEEDQQEGSVEVVSVKIRSLRVRSDGGLPWKTKFLDSEERAKVLAQIPSPSSVPQIAKPKLEQAPKPRVPSTPKEKPCFTPLPVRKIVTSQSIKTTPKETCQPVASKNVSKPAEPKIESSTPKSKAKPQITPSINKAQKESALSKYWKQKRKAVRRSTRHIAKTPQRIRTRSGREISRRSYSDGEFDLDSDSDFNSSSPDDSSSDSDREDSPSPQPREPILTRRRGSGAGLKLSVKRLEMEDSESDHDHFENEADESENEGPDFQNEADEIENEDAELNDSITDILKSLDPNNSRSDSQQTSSQNANDDKLNNESQNSSSGGSCNAKESKESKLDDCRKNLTDCLEKLTQPARKGTDTESSSHTGRDLPQRRDSSTSQNSQTSQLEPWRRGKAFISRCKEPLRKFYVPLKNNSKYLETYKYRCLDCYVQFARAKSFKWHLEFFHKYAPPRPIDVGDVRTKFRNRLKEKSRLKAALLKPVKSAPPLENRSFEMEDSVSPVNTVEQIENIQQSDEIKDDAQNGGSQNVPQDEDVPSVQESDVAQKNQSKWKLPAVWKKKRRGFGWPLGNSSVEMENSVSSIESDEQSENSMENSKPEMRKQPTVLSKKRKGLEWEGLKQKRKRLEFRLNSSSRDILRRRQAYGWTSYRARLQAKRWQDALATSSAVTSTTSKADESGKKIFCLSTKGCSI